MILIRNFLLLLILLVGLTACGALSDLRGESPREQLAVAESLFSGVLVTALELRREGVIEPGSDTAEHITQGLEAIHVALGIAHERITEGQEDQGLEALATAHRNIREVLTTLEDLRDD